MYKFLVLFSLIIAACYAHVPEEPETGIYEINKGDFSIKVTNYGARMISLFLPDTKGKVVDVLLGYDTVKEYMNDTSSFGAIVGRVANRIGGAQFVLNGTLYKLDANEGENMLHGGKRGFSKRVWRVKKLVKDGPSPRIVLAYHSADGEEGFPGAVVAQVTYALVSPYKLVITMKAKALNKPTPVNLAQHNYWNLGGHTSGNILSDKIQIFGSRYTPVNDKLIPTGEIVTVKGTPYDFLKPHSIKSQITQLPNGTKGFDINYALDDDKKGYSMKKAAIVENMEAGRIMQLWTNAPGMQFYSGNFIGDTKGKGGHRYRDFDALCLETQGFPDAVNHPNFPSTIIYPGKNYKHIMVLQFTTWKP